MEESKISKRLLFSGGIGYIFLYVPLIILVLYSFNDSRINVGWVGFTLKWYKVLFSDQQLLEAAVHSLIIALIASARFVLVSTTTCSIHSIGKPP